jgi:sugar phosphate isomerase/epimerase
MIKLCAFADEASDNLEGQIQALKQNNISLIELRNINGKNIKDITEEEAKIYAKALADNNIETWAIGSPIGKMKIEDDFESHLQEARHIFKIAKIFKTDKIRIFSFFLKDYNKYEDLVIERLKVLLEEAKKSGVKLYHENEKDIYGDRLTRVLKLKEKLPELNFIFDPANFLQCGEDIADAINSLHNDTSYFHVKDVVVKTGEIVPAGYGDGMIKEIINKVEKDTVFTIEPHLAIFEGYSDIDKSELKNKFKFSNNEDAFDFAVNAFKNLLLKSGYQENNMIWEKIDE